MSATRSEVLRLYKSILKYGQELKYTNKDFFKQKLRKEFRNCKEVESPEEIKFHVDGQNFPGVQTSSVSMMSAAVCNALIYQRGIHFSAIALRQAIDYSKVPVLKEEDIEEQFVKGHGPGGQNVNKRSNCVLLKHIPTGLIVKCHQSRLLDKNRKFARDLLVDKLDQLMNGDDSVASQRKRIEDRKSSKNDTKKRKLQELKAAWKEQQNEVRTTPTFKTSLLSAFFVLNSRLSRGFATIDYSRVPTINDDDLEEQIIRGSGTHKRTNCILLIHKPTGIVVKGTKSRNLIENRKIARETLIEKLDDKLNGDNSIAAQKRRMESRKSSSRESKRNKMQLLKEAWKENKE